MSRRNNRNTITIDRRELERVIDAAIARAYKPPAGANVTPIPQNIIDMMMQQQAPQSKTGGMWEPGSPIKPVPGLAPIQGPRQYSYQYGINIGQLPRATELNSFQVLRNLAKLYEVIPMCEQVWFDLAGRLNLKIGPKKKYTIDAQGDPIDPKVLSEKYAARIDRWETFWAMPDRDNEMELHPWMQQLLKEMLEIDATVCYRHKDRIGRYYALEPIDGSTIKPLLNERGRKPSDDFPAYEQFIHGTPAMFLRRDELLYKREIEQIDSPYGFSRVEFIIMRVNQALRKENKDLSFFTDGNIPAGFFSPPDDGTTDWTPEQLLMYQQIWDGLLAGNDSTRSRGRWVPPGTVYTKTDPDDIMFAFDDFLTTVTCGAFGVPKTELSFTEKSNRSTGETQEAVIYRRPLATIRKFFSSIMNRVMAEEGDMDLEATWEGYEEPEDFKTKAEAEDILVKNGTMSTSQGAHWLGLTPAFETEPFINVAGQGIVFIQDAMDLREQTMQAKKAGLQMSIDNPGGVQNEQESQQGQQGAQGAMGGAQGQNGRGKQGNASGAGKQGQADSGNAATSAKRSLEPVVSGQSSDAERAIAAEYRRWRECAIKDVKYGHTIRGFTSTIIPEADQQRIRDALYQATTADDVRAVFERARQTAWEPPDVEDQLGILERAEVATVTWQDAPGACSEICLENAGVTVKLGERFPGGQRLAVGHPHCQCTPIYRKADGTQIAVSTGQEVEF